MSAAALKDEGNTKFKSGEFAAAVDAYTKSLDLEPNQHLCFSNRSAAYLKVGNSADKALADADSCVKLAPEFAKGYSRQAAALQELKRFDEAAAACERGLAASSDEALRKTLAEVRNRQFVHAINGCWNGRVTEALGGYEQEMEFFENSKVRIEVLGRSICGDFWVDGTVEPRHLNIQVPMQDIPAGMPQPPPVPYIARINGEGLELCCPYMRMERPTDFEGPGYCLMRRGSLSKAEDTSVANLSTDEKLKLCAKVLVKDLPNIKLEDVKQTDSEEETSQKVMGQVKFESAMFGVQQKFGEDILKEVLNATKAGLGSPDVPKALADSAELAELVTKLKVCGILDLPLAGQAEAVSSSAPQQASHPSTEKPQTGVEKAPAESRTVSPAVAGVVALSLAAVAATALLLWRRQKR
mmetsp:Transcript_103094/g.183185  ORF Transcript_103094/g.183185 Transcript_103094/m.183185 type:complete len:412 (+) Transcript_103094:51-1286(+)|eukprot:CAMPEP_0197654414 /NCGR_PEP_ID=MMETSP1338-20131121/38837_1 /TAXON_ID=43686 ORGANISM="Pelagodinium beii, Strain RCC1491" /NCGR_SAMPLE_ID=MMETSP1338 /ASSEMBLY_ACC=CAM_ASM_000754 /LENGTH=411 /DNA_ID=CAMNT_0043229857 /DNA_START=47 /DNA_END=1282 /DNA_ORIENTATION=+